MRRRRHMSSFFSTSGVLLPRAFSHHGATQPADMTALPSLMVTVLYYLARNRKKCMAVVCSMVCRPTCSANPRSDVPTSSSSSYHTLIPPCFIIPLSAQAKDARPKSRPGMGKVAKTHHTAALCTKLLTPSHRHGCDSGISEW